MSQIIDPISSQAFELVRNRIGEILADELAKQTRITYKPELDATVYIEKFIPFDKIQLPAVNVTLARGEYDNQTAIDSDGTYRYNIDCYHKAPTTSTDAGDSLAMFKLQTLIGVCRAILESSKYKTLGFAAPFIMNRHVENIQIATPAEKKDTTSVVMGRLSFVVRVPEDVDTITPELIAGYDTQVKLGLTDKGYIFSGDDIPVPPITGGAVTVNAVAFGDVDPGDTINVPVKNTYGDEIGSLIGATWTIPDQAYTDSDGSGKSVPASDPIVCIPIPPAGIITINSDAFGSVDPGDTIDISVENTYNDPLGSKVGDKWIIPNQQYKDSDGSDKERPAGDLIVCSPGDLQTEIDNATAAALSAALEANTDTDKIAYRKAPPTGQTFSYRIGDDGWRLQNGIYQYTHQGKHPLLQGEDPDNADGTANDWLMLSPKTPNKYGNLYRLTDSKGGQVFGAGNSSILDYFEEHVGGYGWQWKTGFNVWGLDTWNNAIDAAIAHNNGTYSNFYLPKTLELFTIMNIGTAISLINYFPITLTGTKYLWTGSTFPYNTGRAYNIPTATGTLCNAPTKSTGQHFIFVRDI